MIQSSFVENRSVIFRVLSEDQVSEIKQAAFDVLETIGCDVQHQGALELLGQAGAVVEGHRVRVPRYIVHECIRTAPDGFTIYDRQGGRAMEMEGRKSYYGTATASPRTIDAFTGEMRETRVEDIALGAKVAHGLPHIDWVMPMGSSQDVDPLLADVYEFEAVVTNTTKPIVFIGYSPRGLEMVYEMAAEVAGGLSELQARPFLLAYPEPISPLTYPEEVVDRIFVVADLNLPQIPGPAVQPGGTGPVTLAGTLAQLIAEALMGVVLVQLRQPGAPCFLGGNIGVLDMSTGSMSITAPEMSLGLAAYAEVAQSMGLPTWGLAGSTDSKLLDAQAGIESTFSILAQGLAGLNLIHDVGYMDMGMACSAEMLVMGDEVIGMTKRFIRGIEVNADTVARDVIERVGPGGHYLDDDHTYNRFREALWMPQLLTRKDYTTWKAEGAKNMQQRVRERLEEILQTHQVVPLSDETLGTFEEIKRQREGEVADSGA